ncbi:hypothetical protein EXN32_24530 [Agrobacterium tumefaciens]|nr:hypothetical protein EXN32_24530 [Agrobacterium tumefaciens]
MADDSTHNAMRRRLLQAMAALPVAASGPLALFPVKARAEGSSSMTSIASMASSAGVYQTERVSFESAGVPLIGLLFTPTATQSRMPGVVVVGPFGFVKEQSPMEYATRLARDGFATLIFDPRFGGESGGEPRRYESPTAKIADIKAAISFLAARPEILKDGIFALGICQGSSEMIAAVSDDARIKALATVSGQYLYRENLEGFFGGGGPTLDERIARGQAAKDKFEANGEIDYTPVVSVDDKSVGLPWPEIHNWYHPWTTSKWGEPSRWENRYTTMSDAEVWTFDVDAYAVKLQLPTLMVHGERSDGFVVAVQHVFDNVPAKDKKLVILEGVFHTRFYDDPLVIEPTAAEVAKWFKSNAKSERG